MNYFTFWRRVASRAPQKFLSISSIGEALATHLLPQECAICHNCAGRWPICPPCESGILRHVPSLHCPCCGGRNEKGDLCNNCHNEPPHYDRVIAPFIYTSPLDNLIQQLKYGHRLYLANWLGKELAATIQTEKIRTDIIVPMPLHRHRLRERGFNQSLEIARPLAKLWRQKLRGDWVRRNKDTPHQVGLSLVDRQNNLKGAFDCAADLTGRSALIIDDVMTSGSTVNELARTLKLHGAYPVYVAIAARTPLHY